MPSSNIHAILDHKAKANGVEIVVRMEPKLIEVVADKVKIRQILINLIDNAVKIHRQLTGPHFSASHKIFQAAFDEICNAVNAPSIVLGRVGNKSSG